MYCPKKGNYFFTKPKQTSTSWGSFNQVATSSTAVNGHTPLLCAKPSNMGDFWEKSNSYSSSSSFQKNKYIYIYHQIGWGFFLRFFDFEILRKNRIYLSTNDFLWESIKYKRNHQNGDSFILWFWSCRAASAVGFLSSILANEACSF